MLSFTMKNIATDVVAYENKVPKLTLKKKVKNSFQFENWINWW